MKNNTNINLEEEYEVAHASLSNASQIARKIRSEDPAYWDRGGLLKALAPNLVQSLQKIYARYQISLTITGILIGITLCVGLVAKVYSLTDIGDSGLRSKVVEAFNYPTYTPTFTPTATITPTVTLTPTITPVPIPTDTPIPTISPR